MPGTDADVRFGACHPPKAVPGIHFARALGSRRVLEPRRRDRGARRARGTAARPAARTGCVRRAASAPLPRLARPPRRIDAEVARVAARAALHDQARPACRVSVRDAGGAAVRLRASARLVGDEGQADGRRLYQRRHRRLDRGLRTRPDGGWRRAWRRRAQRLWLRALHGRPGPALRRRAHGLHGRARIGRKHAAPDPAHHRFRGPHPVLHAELCAQHRRDVRRERDRARPAVARLRDLRGRAMERGDAGRDRAPARHHARSTSTD